MLVTGGAGSIGWAAAQRFAAEGARVAIADLHGARAPELAATLDGAVAIEADVSEAETAVARTLDAVGGLAGVFNNAGISGPIRPVFELAQEERDHVIRTNLRSMFLVLRTSIRAMIDSGQGGSIVNMGSSMAGWNVLAGCPGYIASKHAVTRRGLRPPPAQRPRRTWTTASPLCP